MKTKLHIKLLLVCASFFLFISVSNAQSHLEIPIIDGNDDVEEVTNDLWGPTGEIYFESSDLELYWDDGAQFVGTLFRNVMIPKGNAIDSAYIQFVCKSPGAEDVDIEIYGVDSGNVVGIPDILFGVSSKAKTEATLIWSPEPWLAEWDVLPAQRTPNLNAIMNEIVANSDWEPGNNLMFVLTGILEDEIIRHAYSYDMEEEGPVLHVWFTAGNMSGLLDTELSQSNDFNSITYPNPTEGILHINIPSSDKFSYDIYTINGKLVRSEQNIATSGADIDMSDMTKGMYFISLKTIDKTETHKIILR